MAEEKLPKIKRLVCVRIGPVSIRALAAVFAFGFVAGTVQFCAAESIASKNKKGNRLFEQGKYADAEKAYLSAQVDDPGKPEILYNLGNSLVKQKKYREGVQSLGQSINKGDRRVKQKSWYNTGNAFFSEGNYKDAAAAFVEALKLDPADRDAKHNLELALLKIKQQQQESKKNQKGQEKQDSKDPNKDQSSKGKDSRPQKPEKDTGGSGAQNKEMNPRENRPAPSEGSLTKERAMQLLEAVKNQEIEEQRKLMARRARERAGGKDW